MAPVDEARIERDRLRSGVNEQLDRIVARLADELVPGDCLVTMGAGSVYEIADRILQRLSDAAGAAGR